MLLDAFIPETRTHVIAGKTVQVAPLKVRQIPPFARTIGPAMGALASGNIAGAMAVHGEALIDAIAIALNEPADWLGDLNADDFMRLVGEVVEINADFFVQRVMPTLNATVEKVALALSGAEGTTALNGPTPSPSSPAAESASTPPLT